MFAASLNPHGSPYYWAFVGAITLAFAVVDLEALRAHRLSRFHGFSVAVFSRVLYGVSSASFTARSAAGQIDPEGLARLPQCSGISPERGGITGGG